MRRAARWRASARTGALPRDVALNPKLPVLLQPAVKTFDCHHIAFSFLKAKSTIRISNQPSRKREIWVSP